MARQDIIERAIREVVERRLEGVRILSVTATRSFDADDDAVLDVTVVFEAPSDLDAEKVTSMVRHLRPTLAKLNEPGFPLMSFVSKSDARKLGLEPA